MNIIHAAQYQKEMDKIVQPYLERRLESGYFERVQGQKLYYESFRADHPHATLVLLHGFSEGILKFREMIYYFVESGLDVWALQQREHGLSYRSGDDLCLVDIADYKDLIRDAHYFVHKIVRRRGPLYLYGHSMGGAVSACYLECYPKDFKRAVLSSPMLEMNAGSTPVWFAALYARVQCVLGNGGNYMPGTAPFAGVPDFEGSSDDCEERYMSWFTMQRTHPELQMCGSSIRCAVQFLRMTKAAVAPHNVRRIRARVLLFQAGKDTTVNPGGQNKFIRGLGDRGRMVRVADSKHEIYMGEDAQIRKYVETVLEFFR